MSALYQAALTGLRWGPWPESQKDKGEAAWRAVLGSPPPAPTASVWAEHFLDLVIRDIVSMGYERLSEIHPDRAENSGMALACRLLGVSTRPALLRTGFEAYTQFPPLPPEEPEDRKDEALVKARKAETRLREAALAFATATRRVGLITRTTWGEDVDSAMDMNMVTRAIRDVVPLCGLRALETGTRLLLRSLQ